MGWLVYHRHCRTGDFATIVVVVRELEGHAEDVDQAFRSEDIVLDCRTNLLLHVHVPDPFLGAHEIWRWGWVHEFGVSTYSRWAWDGGYLCGWVLTWD